MGSPSLDIWTAFVLGLVGSLHCAGMCGPLALALPAAGATTPGYVLGRVAYNLGRIITYCLLGIVFGLAGWTLLLAGIQRWTCIGLGLVLLLSLAASRRLVRWSPVTLLVEWLKGRMSGLLRRRSFASLAALGLLNGLLLVRYSSDDIFPVCQPHGQRQRIAGYCKSRQNQRTSIVRGE